MESKKLLTRSRLRTRSSKLGLTLWTGVQSWREFTWTWSKLKKTLHSSLVRAASYPRRSRSTDATTI